MSTHFDNDVNLSNKYFQLDILFLHFVFSVRNDLTGDISHLCDVRVFHYDINEFTGHCNCSRTKEIIDVLRNVFRGKL